MEDVTVNPPHVSDKETFLAIESTSLSLFPPFVDNLRAIRFLHEYLGLPQENIILRFFADTIGDDKELHH